MLIRSVRIVATVALALALLCPAVAEARPSATEEAKQHYLKGRAAYDLTHYDEAIAEYELAYRLRPDPPFLFNIAQAHRLAGHYEKAIEFYRIFLRKKPDAPNKQDILDRIAEMEDVLQKQRRQPTMPPEGSAAPSKEIAGDDASGREVAAKDSAGKETATTSHTSERRESGTPTAETPHKTDAETSHETEAATEPSTTHVAAESTKPEPAPKPARPRTRIIAGATLVAVGVALAGAGGALCGIGFSHSDGDQAGDLGNYQSSLSTINTERGAGLALAGVGAAALIAGVVTLALPVRSERVSALHLAPSLGGVSVAGTF